MMGHLLSKEPTPRVSDWGLWRMSVCIDVVAEEETKIVSVCDTKVGFGDFSADNLSLKTEFAAGCRILVAGNDIEHASPILDRSRELLSAIFEPSVRQVAEAIDEAYGERLHVEISRKVLRKRGFDVPTFLEKGKQKCTPSAYLSLCSRIDQVSISLKFLVSGFDEVGAHIYCVDGESAPKNYDSIGMWAIGKGAHAALSLLAFHVEHKHIIPHNRSLEEALFFALAAKFMAESCGDVGRQDTFVGIDELGKNSWFLKRKDVEQIRDIWNAESAPQLPANLFERIHDILPHRGITQSASQTLADQQ